MRFGLAIIAAFGFAIVNAGSAQAQSVAAKYQAPEPRTCASKTDPADGPISAEQAAQYIICDQEYEENGNTLHLLSNVTVQVGNGTPYSDIMESARPADGDSTGIVYPIRGSFQMFSCSIPSDFTPAGQQCLRTDTPKASGRCYRTTFGDWFCSMAADPGGAYPVVSSPPNSP